VPGLRGEILAGLFSLARHDTAFTAAPGDVLVQAVVLVIDKNAAAVSDGLSSQVVANANLRPAQRTLRRTTMTGGNLPSWCRDGACCLRQGSFGFRACR